MPAQQLLLSWKEHSGALVSVFENLLKNNTLVDCTLAAEGQYLKAHKVVLSACSSYFELLFSQESEKNPIVILKDVKFEELEAAVNFMYKGEVEVCEDRLTTFLGVAHSLKIKGLGSDTKSQDSTEKSSLVKNSSGTSALTQNEQSRKEDPFPQSDNAGQSSNVPADCEQIRNNESSSFHQSSRRECSPVNSISTLSVESSSCTVRAETHEDSDNHENIIQLPCFSSGESGQCEENLIVKTEPVVDLFLEDQSDEEERDFGDDVTRMDDQGEWNEPNTKIIDAVPTNQQDVGADWIQPDDQQNFLSVFIKEEPGRSASWNQEVVTRSSDMAEPIAGTSVASAGMDRSLIEDNEPPAPASVHFNLPVTGSTQSAYSLVSDQSAYSSLQGTTTRPPSKKFSCPICKGFFVRMVDLKRHMRSQRCGDLPSVSNFELPTDDTPDGIIRCVKRSSLMCSDCDYVTFSRSHLKLHSLVHTGEKPFKCQHCHYVCARKEHMSSHQRTHAREKPFQCPHCSYVSKRKGNVASHMRTHSKEKPFQCPHCQYASRWKRSLSIHLLLHRAKTHVDR